MLLELAIGDAYGAGFEYAPNRLIREHNTLRGYVKHPRHDIQPGCYTDDTQMTIAIAEAMLSGQEWTPLLLANHFVEAFKRDPREGYAGKFYDFLKSIDNGTEFLEQIHFKSEKSGAAMRACPLGLYADIKTVISRCTLQAKLTHDTPLGMNAAIAASLMTHYFRFHLGPKNKLPDFLFDHVEGEWKSPWKGKVGALGMMSVRAALTAILESMHMDELLE
jgi:ADP-ribosylglycohydrolase